MGDHYGLPDLRQFMAGRTHFPGIPELTEPFFVHRNPRLPHNYETMVVSHQSDEIFSSGLVELDGIDKVKANTIVTNSSYGGIICGLDGMAGGCGGGGDGGSHRWPRQETLTLLETRSLLDSKFKVANQKGPLWDEVSRIMAEEHGYQRSGKKCKEKFENLYKYYKKTKELGKARKQDGKHYRFFHQLESLCGTETNQEAMIKDHQRRCESLSFTNFSDQFETSSSENDDGDLAAIAFMMMNHNSMEKKKIRNNEKMCFKRVRKMSWKSKMKGFVEFQMKKIMDTQEAWMEKMVKIIEHKEEEIIAKEEEWRKKSAARFHQEHEFWANERAWVEAKDAAFVEALKKINGEELGLFSGLELLSQKIENHHDENLDDCNKTIDCGKKPKEDFISSNCLQLLDYSYHGQLINNGFSSSICNADSELHDDTGFPVLGKDGEHSWTGSALRIWRP